MKKLYMRVTRDKYELPLAVADSPRELARLQQTSTNTINACITKGEGSWRKVIYTDEEFERDL